MVLNVNDGAAVFAFLLIFAFMVVQWVCNITKSFTTSICSWDGFWLEKIIYEELNKGIKKTRCLNKASVFLLYERALFEYCIVRAHEINFILYSFGYK